MIAFAKPDNIIAMPTPQGKSNEWYTPSRYIEAARSVMGSIDLDPASCEFANQTVKAKRYFTRLDDGLGQEWKDKTWLNPPYGKVGNKSAIEAWIKKLISEYCKGNVTEAVLLTTCDSDNAWFQLLWDYSICFTDHNVHFYKPNVTGEVYKDSRHTQMFGTIFVYLGPNNEKFAEVFSEFGPVIPANVAVRRQQITPLSLWEVSK